ncbi:cyclic nucleotide-binding domain-containing protein [Kamptonema cortianum]|nr:cyclic nucleotide-binding domain-containing protein [Geitlerinema splendidum]MDK3158478.1 cyclic nucleotide-binding domain-containing protein [Kamptonema cortianum]
MDRIKGIKASYLSSGLTDEQIQAIADISEIVEAGDMQEIVTEADDAIDIYLLLDGNVRVTTVNGDPIARLQAGAIIGEIALFEGSERSATVVSDGASRLVRIPAHKFNRLMDEQPEIGIVVLRNIGKTLCARLRSSNVQLEAVLATLPY